MTLCFLGHLTYLGDALFTQVIVDQESVNFIYFSRLFSLLVGVESEAAFGIESDYFFWIPLVMPHIGGPIGALVYQGMIGWHHPKNSSNVINDVKAIKDANDVIENPSIVFIEKL